MSTCLPWLPIVCLLACPASPAAARKWEYRSESFEAELVDIDGRRVRLVRSGGDLRDYTREQLSEADRRYIDGWIAEHLQPPPGEGVQVTATAHRETVRWSHSAPEPTLVATLRLWGPEAAGATCFRDLKITEAVADDGTPLVLSGNTRGEKTERVRFNRYDANRQPNDGCRVKLAFSAPATPVRTFRRVRGSFKIVTGNPRAVIVDGIYRLQNHEVADETLRKAGLRAIVNPPPRPAGLFARLDRLTVYGVQFVGSHENLFCVDLIDFQGNLFDQYGGRGSADSNWRDPADGKVRDSYAYQFELRPPVSKGLNMRITVLEDPLEVVVPFELTNLAIPPLPSDATEKNEPRKNAGRHP